MVRPRMETMRRSQWKRQLLSLGIVASLGLTAAVHEALAASAPPDFSPTGQTAWVGIGIGALLPVPGSPKPVGQEPAYRYLTKGTPREQPTQRIIDLRKPNLEH